MALTTSSSNSRPIVWARVVFGTKNPNLPVPNLEFYNRETKTTSYQVPEGSNYAPINISGNLRALTIQQVEGYNDRQRGNGEKNAKRVIAVISDPQDDTDYGLTFEVESDLRVPNRNALQLLQALHQHLATDYEVPDGEPVSGRDIPVQIGLYRSQGREKGKFFSNSIVRLPSGYEENGAPIFADPKAFVRAEMLPQLEPRKDPAAEDGIMRDNAGNKLYDFGPHREILARIESSLEAMRTENDGQAASDAPAHDEEGVNVGQAVDEATGAASPRPKA